MNFKKIGALALASVMLLTGCGSTGNNNSTAENAAPAELTGPVEITFWHAMNGAQEESLTKLTEEFMAQNDKVTVKLLNQSSYPDLQQKLTATTASPKDLPTMTQAYIDWMYQPIQDNLVVDLAPYINDEKIGMDDYEDILPGLREAVTIDGKIYGLSFNKSTEVIWYNKTLFDELGLTAPKTMEELVTVSKAIYDAKGIAGAGFDSLSNYYTTFLKNEGVTFEPSLDVTSEASVKAAEYYLTGVKEGYFRIAGTDKYLSGPFGSELVGMYIGSSAGESYVKDTAEGKFEAGVAPYPAEYAIQQGTDLFVFNSASAEQKTAAFEYLKFLTSKESQITWAKDTGYLPIRKSAIESEEYQSAGSMLAPILKEATENLYVNPLHDGTTSAYKESATVLEGILATPDTADVKAALENYKATLTTIWQ